MVPVGTKFRSASTMSCAPAPSRSPAAIAVALTPWIHHVRRRRRVDVDGLRRALHGQVREQVHAPRVRSRRRHHDLPRVAGVAVQVAGEQRAAQARARQRRRELDAGAVLRVRGHQVDGLGRETRAPVDDVDAAGPAARARRADDDVVERVAVELGARHGGAQVVAAVDAEEVRLLADRRVRRDRSSRRRRRRTRC